MKKNIKPWIKNTVSTFVAEPFEVLCILSLIPDFLMFIKQSVQTIKSSFKINSSQ